MPSRLSGDTIDLRSDHDWLERFDVTATEMHIPIVHISESPNRGILQARRAREVKL